MREFCAACSQKRSVHVIPEPKRRDSVAWEDHRREQERDWARLPAVVRLRALEEMKRFAEQFARRREPPVRSSDRD